MAQRNHELEMRVHYRHPIFSGDPECADLIDWVDSASLFDVGREALSVLRPRKRFATDFGVTVGSVRSGKGGQYYVGPRNLSSGIAKLNEYLAKERLGNYSAHYWGPPMTLSVSFDLARPATRTFDGWFIPTSSVSIAFNVDQAEHWAGECSDHVFELFVRATSISQPLTARGSWWSSSVNYEYERAIGMGQRHGNGQATIPGYRFMLYLPPDAVHTLGGVDSVVTQAPVLNAIEIPHGDEGKGVAARLCRYPDELTVDRLERWRSYLLPVVDLPPQLSSSERAAGGRFGDRVSEIPCPSDVLPSDFHGM